MDRIQVGAIVSRTLSVLIACRMLFDLLYMAPSLIGSRSGNGMLIAFALANLLIVFLLWTKAGTFGKLPTDQVRSQVTEQPLDRSVFATVAIRVASIYFSVLCLLAIAYSRWLNMDDPNGMKQLFLREQPSGWGTIGLLGLGIIAFVMAPRLARNV